MRKPSRKVAFLGALALAATGVFATATAANAQLVTRCIGEAGAVTVPGDLVVPAGRTCVLTGTTVTGDVRVQAGADLVVEDGDFNARVVVQADGFLDASSTEIGGNIVNNGAYGIYIEGSSVAGHYVGRDADVDSSFLYSFDNAINGRVESVLGDVYLNQTTVNRFVNTEGTTYTDIVDSTILRELTASNNEFGVAVCASEVDGNTTLVGNDGVQLGAGPLIQCADVNYFGGDVTVSDNTGGVDVTGNIIRGNLSGEGNDPAPTGSDNRVRGEVSGQFTDLAPAAQLMSRQSDTVRSSSEVRTPEDVLKERDERREAAVGTAEEIGSAGF